MKKVLYVQYANPAAYPPVEHSSRVFATRGWTVLFLGIGSFGANSFRLAPHPNIRIRQWFFCRQGILQKLHYSGYCLWSILWAVLWRPNLVYASDLFSCPIGRILVFLGFKVIYHEHDAPNFGKEGQRSFFMGLLLGYRRSLAKQAKICIIPNEKRASLFQLEMGPHSRVRCVYNCVSLEEIPQAVTKPHAQFIILYHGSIVPARLPIAVLEAIARLPSHVKLRVIGYATVGYPDYIAQLKRKAVELALGDRLEVIGEVSTRAELLRLGGECHVGISLMPLQSEDTNEQHMSGASNKPFDFLSCGLSLLVSDLADWKKMFVESGYGLACDPSNADSILAALEWFINHPKETRQMGDRGRQRIISEWNYEKQFAPVLNEIEAYAQLNHREDQERDGRQSQSDGAVKQILYIQYTNPGLYPPLEHSSRILAGNGWRVLFLGTGSFGGNALRLAPHPMILTRLWPFRSGGLLQKLHFFSYSIWTVLFAIVSRPQCIYASGHFSCPAGALLAFLKFNVIYHEHDSPTHGSEHHPNFFVRLILVCRRLLARRARICIIPNVKRASVFQSDMGNGIDIRCVWNCPSLEEIPVAFSKSDEILRLLYMGTIGTSRLPFALLDGLKKLKGRAKLRIVGFETVDSRGYISQLLERANQIGLADSLEIIAEVSRSNLFEKAKECHVGLSLIPLETRDFNERYSATASNKAFDYLACGLSVLVPDLPDWKQMFVESGYGLACDPSNADSISAALEWFINHPKETRQMGDRGRQRIISEWNYEKQFAPVLNEIEAYAQLNHRRAK